MSAETFTGITLARILRARGLRGEVAAEILTDFPERLLDLHEVWLADGKGAPRQVTVARCWLSTARGGQVIFHFVGVDTVEAAEKLRDAEVQVPFDQRMVLGDGQYYVSDLVGCEVWEAGASAALGTVGDVEFPGGVPLLSIQTPKGEVLVPLAAQFCIRIDIQAKRIDVDLPEGLRDLNHS